MSNPSSWKGLVERVRRAGTAKGRAASGYFAIEGYRLHERAVRARVPVEVALVTRAFMTDATPRLQSLREELQRQGCQLVTIPEVAMRELTAGRDLGWIMGLVRLPQQPALRDLVAAAGDRNLLFLIALDVRDPGNVGALVRTAHASGATAFIAVGVSDPYHPRALRTTLGSLFKLPVLYYAEAAPLLRELEELGVPAVGTSCQGGESLPEVDFGDSGSAVFVGSEAWGLSPDMQAVMKRLVSVPMAPGVDSYSVNAAAAVVLYEINRRRRWLPE